MFQPTDNEYRELPTQPNPHRNSLWWTLACDTGILKLYSGPRLIRPLENGHPTLLELILPYICHLLPAIPLLGVLNLKNCKYSGLSFTLVYEYALFPTTCLPHSRPVMTQPLCHRYTSSPTLRALSRVEQWSSARIWTGTWILEDCWLWVWDGYHYTPPSGSPSPWQPILVHSGLVSSFM